MFFWLLLVTFIGGGEVIRSGESYELKLLTGNICFDIFLINTRVTLSWYDLGISRMRAYQLLPVGIKSGIYFSIIRTRPRL